MTYVVFWNTQRASNIDDNVRAGFMWETVKSWETAPRVPAFDILILAEVTTAFATLLGDMRAYWPSVDADYFPCRKSIQCSYLGIWNRALTGPPEPFGSDRRPMLKFTVNGVEIAGCHLTSRNVEKASEEACAACTHMSFGGGSGVLIGDMNVNFDSITRDAKRNMTEIGYSAVKPRLAQTFRTGGVLDYAWKDNSLGVDPDPPWPGYNDWTIIDHAPIGYRIR